MVLILLILLMTTCHDGETMYGVLLEEKGEQIVLSFAYSKHWQLLFNVKERQTEPFSKGVGKIASKMHHIRSNLQQTKGSEATHSAQLPRLYTQPARSNTASTFAIWHFHSLLFRIQILSTFFCVSFFLGASSVAVSHLFRCELVLQGMLIRCLRRCFRTQHTTVGCSAARTLLCASLSFPWQMSCVSWVVSNLQLDPSRIQVESEGI